MVGPCHSSPPPEPHIHSIGLAVDVPHHLCALLRSLPCDRQQQLSLCPPITPCLCGCRKEIQVHSIASSSPKASSPYLLTGAMTHSRNMTTIVITHNLSQIQDDDFLYILSMIASSSRASATTLRQTHSQHSGTWPMSRAPSAAFLSATPTRQARRPTL
jgi:hypothetical protein